MNGCLKTRKVYTKVETDNKEDYMRILNCNWPDKSFDCDTRPTVLREGIAFKLELMNFEKDIKLEQHKESIEDLKYQGLRNLRRSTRFDQVTMEEHKLNKIEFNVISFEILRAVLLDGVSVECTKRNHDVQPHFDRVRNCKNCQEYGHTTKSCKNPQRCGKCPSKTHNVATCTTKQFLECCHCHMGHEAGTPRCKRFFEENYRKNEFIIRFLIDECGASNPFEVLGLPVPDGMSIDDDEILTTAEELAKESTKDDMVNWFEAYVQSKNIGGIDHELREEVDTLKKTSDLHGSRISQLERDIDNVKETLTAKIENRNGTRTSGSAGKRCPLRD